jgi:hypothetical protein
MTNVTVSRRSQQCRTFSRNVRALAQDVASLRADIEQYRTDLRQVFEWLLLEYNLLGGRRSFLHRVTIWSLTDTGAMNVHPHRATERAS